MNDTERNDMPAKRGTCLHNCGHSSSRREALDLESLGELHAHSVGIENATVAVDELSRLSQVHILNPKIKHTLGAE